MYRRECCPGTFIARGAQRPEFRRGKPSPVTTVSILPGGTHRVWIRGTGWTAAMGGRPGAEVAFTDRAGTSWIRRATGELEELDGEPFTYFTRYGLYGPYDLQTPQRIG